MRKSLLVVVEIGTQTGCMSIVITLIVLPLLFAAGLSPWWIAGRYVETSGERVALRDLGVDGVIETLRRGANMYVPGEFRSTRA